MSALSDKRCLNHREREAVARCPSCREFYCRECVTEHEGRVVCAKCLAAITAPEKAVRARMSLVQPLLALLGVVLVWASFFALGRTLLLLPDAFHEGPIWGATDASVELIEIEP